jgi:hypothetical protein
MPISKPAGRATSTIQKVMVTVPLMPSPQRFRMTPTDSRTAAIGPGAGDLTARIGTTNSVARPQAAPTSQAAILAPPGSREESSASNAPTPAESSDQRAILPRRFRDSPSASPKLRRRPSSAAFAALASATLKTTLMKVAG